MVGRHAVDAPDVDLLLEQPRHQVGVRSGMAMDVLLLVGLGAELRVAVPAGVQDEEVAVPDLDSVLDHLRRVDLELAHRVTQVDDRRRPVEPLERDLVDGHAVGDEVARRVEVGAHVVRGHDVLRVDAVLGLALDVLDLERRVVGPERDFLIERLRQVVELRHCTVPERKSVVSVRPRRAPRRRSSRSWP